MNYSLCLRRTYFVLVWFICWKAYQLFMCYLISKLDSIVNIWWYYIFNDWFKKNYTCFHFSQMEDDMETLWQAAQSENQIMRQILKRISCQCQPKSLLSDDCWSFISFWYFFCFKVSNEWICQSLTRVASSTLRFSYRTKKIKSGWVGGMSSSTYRFSNNKKIKNLTFFRCWVALKLTANLK